MTPRELALVCVCGHPNAEHSMGDPSVCCVGWCCACDDFTAADPRAEEALAYPCEDGRCLDCLGGYPHDAEALEVM